MAAPFHKGGLQGWCHDEGHAYGYFHTYDEFKPRASDKPRKIHVLLPREYDSELSRNHRYPVLYMNDGHNVFWSGSFGKSWRVADILSNPSLMHQIEKIIVVAIVPHDRSIEYTHTFWHRTHKYGGIAEYTNYVADSVKGWIDAHYRTDPAANRTGILGSSHGGLAAFIMATTRPDRFGLAGCMSPSFWAGLDFEDSYRTTTLSIRNGYRKPAVSSSNGSIYKPEDVEAVLDLWAAASAANWVFRASLLDSKLIQDAKRALRSDPAVRPKLWIDWGLNRDGGPFNSVIEEWVTQRGREMVTLLTSAATPLLRRRKVEDDDPVVKGFDYQLGVDLHVFEDAHNGHTEEAWQYRLPFMLRAFFGPQQERQQASTINDEQEEEHSYEVEDDCSGNELQTDQEDEEVDGPIYDEVFNRGLPPAPPPPPPKHASSAPIAAAASFPATSTSTRPITPPNAKAMFAGAEETTLYSSEPSAPTTSSPPLPPRATMSSVSPVITVRALST